MTRRKGLDVHDYLGKTEVLDVAGGAENLAYALQEYVGSGGRFTAITKMSVLHVDDKRLQGLEIIDTPVSTTRWFPVAKSPVASLASAT